MRVLFSLFCGILAVASSSSADIPVKLSPVEVKEKPFGELGINVNCRTTWLAMVSKDAKIEDMVINEVKADSVAEKSGLKLKDQVMTVDGIAVSELSIRDVIRIWREKGVGDHVRFEVWRARTKETKIIEIPVEKKKAPAIAASRAAASGNAEKLSPP